MIWDRDYIGSVFLGWGQIENSFWDYPTFVEVKGFFPIAIDVLTGLVVMLTSRLVISTVACILIFGMVELEVRRFKNQASRNWWVVSLILVGHGPPKKDVKGSESGCKDLKIQNLKFQTSKTGEQ